MGKVIQFGGRRPAKPSGPSAGASSQVPGGRGSSMFDFVESVLEEIPGQGTLAQLLKTKRFLDSLRGAVNEANVRLWQEGLKRESDDRIRTLVMEGHELSWTAKPAFYRALVREAHRRDL